MRKLNFGEDADGRYKALGVGERTSKKVSRIKMTDGSSFKRRNANQYGDAEGGNEYVETRSNRSDSYNLGGTADSADKGADIGGTLGSSTMKRGGSTSKLKEISLPNSNLYLYGWGRDTNGNSIIKIGFPNRKGFSIQTNGVLPFSNSMKNTSLSDLSENDIEKIEKEVVNYVTNYGSSNQKSIMKKYKDGGGTKSAFNSTKEKMKDKTHQERIDSLIKFVSQSNWSSKPITVKDNMVIVFSKMYDLEPTRVASIFNKYQKESYANGGGTGVSSQTGFAQGTNADLLMNQDYLAYKKGGSVKVGDKVMLPEIKMRDGKIQFEEVENGKVLSIENGIYDVLNPKTNRIHRVTLNQIKYANGGGLANVPESFPETDAMSYKTGGGVNNEEINLLLNGYFSAVLFAETDYDTEESLDANYSMSDFDKETVDSTKKMLTDFYSKNKKAIKDSGLDLDTIGMDIWYARAGHGAGFFDHNLDSDVEQKLTKGAKALGEYPTVETYDGKISIRGGRVFKANGGGLGKGFEYSIGGL